MGQNIGPCLAHICRGVPELGNQHFFGKSVFREIIEQVKEQSIFHQNVYFHYLKFTQTD
jgi:hypothetical protein